jgi:hypothetical protein
MKKLLLILPILSLLCLGASEKTDWKNWPVYRELKGPVPSAGGFAAVVLDDGYWPKDGGGLANLRVAGADGTEIPYFIRTEYKVESSRDLPVSLLENKVWVGEKTMAVLDLGKSRPSNRIDLDSPNENFGRKVVVEGSLDNKNWKTLLADGFIFDVSNSRNPARKAYLSYPEAEARYLRVTISLSGQTEAFILNKATVRAFVPETGQEEEFDFSGTPQKSENGETTWLLDRGRADLPLKEVDFDFESRNFYRPVRVELSNDQKSWSPLLTCGFLYDAQTGGTENQWTLSGPEASGRYVRITVTDGNDKPLAVKKITLKRWRRAILFRPVGSGPFRLYYGNSQGKEPSYDLQSWTARTAYQETPWTAGEESPNPGYAPPSVPLTGRASFVCFIIIVVMGVLAWFLWVSFKKLMATPPHR